MELGNSSPLRTSPTFRSSNTITMTTTTTRSTRHNNDLGNTLLLPPASDEGHKLEFGTVKLHLLTNRFIHAADSNHLELLFREHDTITHLPRLRIVLILLFILSTIYQIIYLATALTNP